VPLLTSYRRSIHAKSELLKSYQNEVIITYKDVFPREMLVCFISDLPHLF
jgi:hypothetical protein